jgi:AraC-like DNA-binding protein
MAGKSAVTRGILNPMMGERSFRLARLEPGCSEMASFIEFYWIARWELRNRAPYLAETLPSPSINIVVEANRPSIYGVVTTKFSRKLVGSGRAFGIKFRPGMFFPFLNSPVAALTDRAVSLRTVFGTPGMVLKHAILAEQEGPNCAKLIEAFFMPRLRKESCMNREVRDIVERIAVDRTITRVEQISSLLGVGIRSLQRTFDKYVGVGPKWVIRRCRLQEAAEALIRSEKRDLLSLALELGYFDQAHFCRDFKRVVGHTPGEYLARSPMAAPR